MRLSYSALLGLPSARFRLKGAAPRLSRLNRLHSVSTAVWPCLLLQPCATTMALTPAARHLGLQVSPLISPHLPSIPPPATLRAPVSLYTPQTSVPDVFRTSPWKSRLVATHRRIGFVILRTASSPPVAPHPASQRRSYLQLQGLGLPWHGLSPCWCRAFTGALIPDLIGDPCSLGLPPAACPRPDRGRG